MADTAEWLLACGADEVGADRPFLLEEPGVAVFEVDGEYFALDDLCSHDEASLSEGYVDGDVVECPYHLARFCIRTGQALSLPATRPVRSHAVRVDSGKIYVQVRQGGDGT